MSELDAEILAMSEVAAALDKLDDDSKRARVLRWATDRYGVTTTWPQIPATNVTPSVQSLVDALKHNTSPKIDELLMHTERLDPAFVDFVDLFDAVDPKTDVDKALTGAYWLQVVGGDESWQSLRVNNLLKDTGNGVANVTSALRSAQERKPALVRQVRKSGKSAQAWKQYRLTTAGVSYMRRKLGLTQNGPTPLQDDDE